METNANEMKYFEAKKRVRKIKKFYTGLIMYILFISFLGLLNYYLDGWEYPWFLWAAFGWGIGLFFQAMDAFQIFSGFGKEWEKRKIEEFLKEDEDRF